MDSQRAKEIALSPVMANVTFEGEQVYIQQVNDDNSTARIYPLESPNNQQVVPIASLTEQ